MMTPVQRRLWADVLSLVMLAVILVVVTAAYLDVVG